VLLYNADLNLSKPHRIRNLNVGSTPDMLTFTPDGKMILVANTGSPPRDIAGPPPKNAFGSVSLIDIHRGPKKAKVSTVDFSIFNGQKETLRTEGVRIYKGEYGDWSVAQSLQPEYIAVPTTPSSMDKSGGEQRGGSVGYREWADN